MNQEDSMQNVPDHFFRDLVETMNEAVWVGDNQERTIYANPRFCEIMEYSLEEMIGRESYEFWDPESAETVRKTNQWKRKQGVRSSYHWVLVSRTGKKVPVILSGSPVPGGWTVGIMTDLTEYKKLQRKERAISQAISIASDCVFSYSPDGSIITWNRGAKTILGYKPHDIEGKNISLVFPEEQSDAFFRIIDNFSQTRFRAIDQAGNPIVLSGAITPIVSETDNTIIEYLFIGRDITRQINIEAQIDQHCLKIKDAYMQLGLLQRQLDYVQDIIKYWKGQYWSNMGFYDFILRSLFFISDSELVQLWMCDTKWNMILNGAMGKVQIFPVGTKKKYPWSATEYAIQQGRTLKIVEPEKHGEFEQFSPIKSHHHIYGVMIIPLGTLGSPIGAIEIYVSEEKSLELFENKFIEDYVSVIELVVKKSGAEGEK